MSRQVQKGFGVSEKCATQVNVSMDNIQRETLER